MTKDIRELLPCPFCGDEDIEVAWRVGRYGKYGYVVCGYCGAQTRTVKLENQDPSDKGFWTQPSFDRVLKLWNKREA